MSTETFPGQIYKTDITVMFMGKDWVVEQKVTHRRSVDLINWDEETLQITNQGEDLRTTMAESMMALEEIMKNIEFDLFNLRFPETYHMIQEEVM